MSESIHASANILMSQKYPVGIETFSKIIEGGFAYVDKTEVIYRLTQSHQFVFLSRPRRFGKSLMLSTVEAYFEGRKDLFEGLWLGQAEDVDWTPRPVLRLNFVSADSSSEEAVEGLIENHLTKWERKYGVTDIVTGLGQRFRNLIESAYEVTGQKVVILIDEYDKVLVNTMHDEERHSGMKAVLKSMFSVLKDADRYIQFAMLTGVSRFSKLSIFSDINNLKDISLDDKYSMLCGITEDEVRRYFAPGVEAFAEEKDTDFEGMMQILKDNYDGYHFSKRCPDIYNPFSLINALDDSELRYRWFESGTPTFLLERIRNTDEDIREVLSVEVSATDLLNSAITDTNLYNILYQTGYLTIKQYDKEYDVFKLGIPNREVEFGMYKGLLPLYTGKEWSENSKLLLTLRRAINAGDIGKFMGMLKSYLAGVPYALSDGKSELYFESNLYMIFRLLGYDVRVEEQTSHSRMDIMLPTPKYIYIIELKLGGSAEAALRQIEEKEYTLPYAIDGREIIPVGVNFSKETRTIEDWIVGESLHHV